jgi:hypothetical protein
LEKLAAKEKMYVDALSYSNRGRELSQNKASTSLQLFSYDMRNTVEEVLNEQHFRTESARLEAEIVDIRKAIADKMGEALAAGHSGEDVFKARGILDEDVLEYARAAMPGRAELEKLDREDLARAEEDLKKRGGGRGGKGGGEGSSGSPGSGPPKPAGGGGPRSGAKAADLVGGLAKNAKRVLMGLPVVDVLVQQYWHEELGYGGTRTEDMALNVTVANIWETPIALASIVSIVATVSVAGTEAGAELAAEKSGLNDLLYSWTAEIESLYGIR